MITIRSFPNPCSSRHFGKAGPLLLPPPSSPVLPPGCHSCPIPHGCTASATSSHRTAQHSIVVVLSAHERWERLGLSFLALLFPISTPILRPGDRLSCLSAPLDLAFPWTQIATAQPPNRPFHALSSAHTRRFQTRRLDVVRNIPFRSLLVSSSPTIVSKRYIHVLSVSPSSRAIPSPVPWAMGLGTYPGVWVGFLTNAPSFEVDSFQSSRWSWFSFIALPIVDVPRCCCTLGSRLTLTYPVLIASAARVLPRQPDHPYPSSSNKHQHGAHRARPGCPVRGQ